MRRLLSLHGPAGEIPRLLVYGIDQQHPALPVAE